jgi:hypothetical protein
MNFRSPTNSELTLSLGYDHDMPFETIPSLPAAEEL